MNIHSINVRCASIGCPSQSITRTVMLRAAAIGVVEQPVLLCADCGRHMVRVSGWPPDQGEAGSACRGSSSPTSGGTSPGSGKPSRELSPSRARAAESPSRRPATGRGTARSAAGAPIRAGGETA